MYLQRITELNLLDPTLFGPHVLSSFPSTVAQPLVKSITKLLWEDKDYHRKQFLTLTHVDWCLEVLGHGFSLPLTDYKLIEACVGCYSQWLLEPHTRPCYFESATIEEEQRFLQKLLLHLSQVFLFVPGSPPTTPRPESELVKGEGAEVEGGGVPPPLSPTIPASIIQKYVDLCKRVTSLYTSVGRLLGPSLTPATWRVLLVCLLGATDHLINFEPLTTETSTPSFTLASEVLCDPATRALMETWLRSETREESLWDGLTQCFQSWIKRSIIIRHWNVVLYALTSPLMASLDEKTPRLELNLTTFAYNASFLVSPTMVGFLWYKIFYLLPPTAVPSSQGRSLVLEGITKMLDLIEGSYADTTTGNTLLRLFGPWLFDICRPLDNNARPLPIPMPINACSEESAVALKLLCHIFARRPLDSFWPQYRESLLNCLRYGLTQDLTLQVILIHGVELFGQDQLGVALLPDLLVSFRHLIPTLAPEFRLQLPLKQIRDGVLRIIALTYSLPLRYPSSSLPDYYCPPDFGSPLPTGLPSEIPSGGPLPFSQLTLSTLQLLFQFLTLETDLNNFYRALNLLELQICLAPPTTQPSLIQSILQVIMRRTFRDQTGMGISLACLETIGKYIDQFPLVLQSIQPDIVPLTSDYILKLLDQDDFGVSGPAIVSGFLVLTRWLTLISFDKVSLANTRTFHTICRGLAIAEMDPISDFRQRNPLATLRQSNTIRHRSRSTVKPTTPYPAPDTSTVELNRVQIWISAKLALNALLSHHKLTTPLDDLSIAQEQLHQPRGASVQYYFLPPDTLVGIVEYPNRISIVIRDPFGSNSWCASSAHTRRWSQIHTRAIKLNLQETDLAIQSDSSTTTSLALSSLLESHDHLDHLPSEDRDTIPCPPPNRLDTLLLNLIEKQKFNQILAQHQNKYPILPKEPPRAASSHHLKSRQWLFHSGLISSDDQAGLVPLLFSPNLITKVASIDQLSTRIAVPVTLRYSSTLELHPDHAPTSLPKSFVNLAESLALPHNHPGCDFLADIVLDCQYLKGPRPHVIPLDDNPANIVVVYLDVMKSISHYQQGDLPQKLLLALRCSYLMLVAPESPTRFRVRLASAETDPGSSSHPRVGPLSDDVVIQGADLGSLIRRTAIAMKIAQLTSHSCLTAYLAPHLTRLAHLNQLTSARSAVVESSLKYTTDPHRASYRSFALLLHPTRHPHHPHPTTPLQFRFATALTTASEDENDPLLLAPPPPATLV